MVFPQDAAVEEAMAWIEQAPGSTPAEDLVAQLDKLPYAARIRAVSVWASRHRDNAAAMATINSLVDAPPSGEPLEVSVDDEFSNLFPPQRTGVTAKFHVHQAGVFAAAAIKNEETLKETAASASRLMKRLAVKEVTRSVSDQDLDTMIRAALPKDRREFMHQCMRFRKHAVLDAVFNAVLELDGENVAARVLHGLSSGGVAQHLPSLIANKRLLWPKLWRFHEQVLLAQLRSELEAAHRLEVAGIWSKWQPFFTAPLVRTTHHRIWRELLGLFLKHRPVKLCCKDSLVKFMTNLSKQGTLPEDPETVSFVKPRWVPDQAMVATVRDPESSDPSAFLLNLVRSSMINLAYDDGRNMDIEEETPSLVGLKHGSLASEAMDALLGCAHKNKKFKYPLEAVLDICRCITEKVPLEFIYNYSFNSTTSKGPNAMAVAAYQLAMSTLDKLLNGNTHNGTVLDIDAVVAIGHNLVSRAAPTPSNLGVDLRGGTLLEKISSANAIRSVMDAWLQVARLFWTKSLELLAARGCEMAKCEKNLDEICVAMTTSVASLTEVYQMIVEHCTEYAKVFKDLDAYGMETMMGLLKVLVIHSQDLAEPVFGALDQTVDLVQPLRDVYHTACARIVDKFFLPRWRGQLQFNRTDKYKVGGAFTAATRLPYHEELSALKNIAVWLRTADKVTHEPLLIQVLKLVTDWSDWVFSAPSEDCKHWIISQGKTQWMAASESVVQLCQHFQRLASGQEPTDLPKLAVQAYEAVLRALKLTCFSTQTGAPLDGPLMMHCERAYIAALEKVPQLLRAEPAIKDPAVDMILSSLQQTLTDKDNGARTVKSTVARLPSEIRKMVVTTALVPGGALDELPATLKKELHLHADLSNPDVKKLLRKSTDSSQAHHRLAAITTLLQCASRSEDMTVMTENLNFVASRIQNETATNRDAVLQHIIHDVSNTVQAVALSKERLASEGENSDEDIHTAVWLRLLEDLTSSADFEESTSLDLFSKTGARMLDAALLTCVEDTLDGFRPLCATAKAWAELGTEMIWRVHVANYGAKKAAESFGAAGMSISHGTLKAIRSTITCVLKKAENDQVDGKPGAEDEIAGLHTELRKLVDFVHNLYHARVQASDAHAALSEGLPSGGDVDWASVNHADPADDMDDMDDMEIEKGTTSAVSAATLRAFGHELVHLRTLVKLTGRCYTAVPLLQGKLELMCSVVATAGHTTLRCIEKFVSEVLKVHTKAHPWQSCSVLVSYHDTLLRRFGTHGFGMSNNRFLVSVHDELTPVVSPDEFLARWLSIHLPRKDAKKAMGRPAFQARKAAAVAALLDMSPSAIHIKLVWRFLVAHRQDLLTPFITPEGSHIPGIFHPTDGGVELEERAGAAFVKPALDWAADETEETPSEYRLPATYGLRKLLQPQAAVLADKWRAMAIDTEISATERARGVARYCSSPAVAFSDQVETINELWTVQNERLAVAKEAAAEVAAAAAAVTAAELTGDRSAKVEAVAAGKAARAKKADSSKEAKTILPLPVSEALLEGMMRGDEPSAPFGFLLSPQMLARTEARVTMQVLDRAVGMIPPTDIAKFASILLGNRDIRRAMKVTVHKALLRLLRHSTDDGPLLVLREWKRKELHRDVRIVILQCALELLHTSGTKTAEEVWTILESAAADVTLDPVVKAVLLAPDQEYAPVWQPWTEMSSNDLLKLVAECGKGAAVHKNHLPEDVHGRYFEKVICVLNTAELSARVKYAEEASSAASEVLELKTAKDVGNRKQQLAAAATRSTEAQARGRAADDLRALLVTTLAAWGAEPARSLQVAQMLGDALNDEDTSVLHTEPGVESAGRNTEMFRVVPESLAAICLQTRLQRDGNTYTYPVEDLRNVLENAVTTIANRIMSVGLGERAVRSACFQRLSSLHDAVTCRGKTKDKELLRSALAPMAWLKEEADQMATLARKRLPTEEEERKAKKARSR